MIFESAVINEYIDEIHPPALHPSDPLQRALNRAWIEFGSGLLVNQYEMMVAKDNASFDKKCRETKEKLAQIERQLSTAGAFFNGEKFSLVDAAIAPFFMRLDILERRIPALKLITTPRLEKWRDMMLARPSVQQSVIKTFPDKLLAYLHQENYYIASLF